MKKLLFALILIPLFLRAENPQQFEQDKNTTDTDKKVNRIIEQISDPNFKKIKVGTFTSAAVTGNQSITGVGFRPRLVELSYSRNSGADEGSMASGWFTDSDQSTASSFTILNAESYTKEHDSSLVIQVYDKDGVVKVTISRVSMDKDGFTINYGYNEAGYTGKLISYKAFE